jgi:hypothetical protein
MTTGIDSSPSFSPLGPTSRGKFAGVDWFDLNSGESGNRRQLLNALGSVLNAENVMVLAGLGTSLGLTKKAASGDVTPAGAPAMITLYSRISSLTGFAEACAIAPEAVGKMDIESLLSACQFHVALSAEKTILDFLAEAEAAILDLCNFVDSETDLMMHEVFLRKIGRRQSRLARSQLFTTNYDLAFEKAAERIRFQIIDGFGFGPDRPFDGSTFDLDIVRRRGRGENPSLEPNVFQLLKLHGSVDWDEQHGEVRRRSKPNNPVLIYPSQNKFQLAFRPPYLESMSRFQIALRQPDVSLIVVGFGFNDAHIVAPLEAAIRSNIGLQIVVVDPTVSSSKNVTVRRLERLVEAGDRRLTLIETTFEDFVKLMPDVGSKDDRELHDDRVSQGWDAE